LFGASQLGAAHVRIDRIEAAQIGVDSGGS
jgi:hypothetical protein